MFWNNRMDNNNKTKNKEDKKKNQRFTRTQCHSWGSVKENPQKGTFIAWNKSKALFLISIGLCNTLWDEIKVKVNMHYCFNNVILIELQNLVKVSCSWNLLPKESHNLVHNKVSSSVHNKVSFPVHIFCGYHETLFQIAD